MSTHKIATDPKYHIGTSSDVKIASVPAQLYYEQNFTTLPPVITPALGPTQRTDIYSTASIRGLYQHMDMVFDVENVNTTEALAICHITKMMQWMRVFLNDVQVLFMDDADCAYFCTTRNLVLQTNSQEDFRNHWIKQGTPVGGPGGLQPFYNAETNIELQNSTTGLHRGRVTVPLDFILSNLFHKFDSALVNKISIEVKWPNATGDPGTTGTFIRNRTANVDIYPDVRFTNSFIQQRMSLYQDQAMFKSLSEMYVKPMLNFERQQFTMSRSVTGATELDPAKVIIKLSDKYAYHKRILGLCLVMNPDYPNFLTIRNGQCWQKRGCTATIKKGGKVLEQLDDVSKFNRQSNHFMKCLGAQWTPITDYVDTGNLADSGMPWWANGNAGNYISFMDRNITEGHSDMQMTDKIQLVSGVSNDLSEAWSVEINIWDTLTITNKSPWNDQLAVYMIYTELLGITPSTTGQQSKIKVFS